MSADNYESAGRHAFAWITASNVCKRANGMTIRPYDAGDYDELLRSATSKGSMVGKIVHLWSLDSSDPEKANLKAVEEAQTLGPVSILQMVQALERAQQPASPKLWLVSRGAQPAGEKASSLALLQSPLWGLGRTIAMESGDCWGGQVDLDPADTPAAAALLLRQSIERGMKTKRHFAMAAGTSCGWLGGLKRYRSPNVSPLAPTQPI